MVNISGSINMGGNKCSIKKGLNTSQIHFLTSCLLPPASCLFTLATYQRLGVAEVWFWQTNHLQIYHLRLENHGYEQIKFSALLPNLNIALLEECVLISDQIEAINEFERRI
ncbi:MAG TPA: hypothetical protein VK184_05630 [Nostocaceae cyanobacterium]|nr:hypothetical protein [Nostocaceae cyanobacterium]